MRGVKSDAVISLKRAMELGSETAAVNYLSAAKQDVRPRLQLAVAGPLLELRADRKFQLSPAMIAWIKRAVQVHDYHSMALMVVLLFTLLPRTPIRVQTFFSCALRA